MAVGGKITKKQRLEGAIMIKDYVISCFGESCIIGSCVVNSSVFCNIINLSLKNKG